MKGENNRCYRIFPKINYCPCQAFKHQVIEKKIQITCKHVLIARIACMLGKTVDREVTQDQYSMLIMSMFDLEDQNGWGHLAVLLYSFYGFWKNFIQFIKSYPIPRGECNKKKTLLTL